MWRRTIIYYSPVRAWLFTYVHIPHWALCAIQGWRFATPRVFNLNGCTLCVSLYVYVYAPSYLTPPNNDTVHSFFFLKPCCNSMQANSYSGNCLYKRTDWIRKFVYRPTNFEGNGVNCNFNLMVILNCTTACGLNLKCQLFYFSPDSELHTAVTLATLQR